MEQFSNNSFIFKLTSHEIDEICDDLALFQSGYRFFYAVDSYDFVHFFFPYIERIQFTEERINNLAQDAIAYESFFSDSKMGSIILLNEYKKELLAIRDLFFARIRSAFELASNIGKVAEEILEVMNDKERSFEAIDKNYELFFLSLILMQKQESIKGTSFLQFLKKKIHVNQIETNDPDFNDLANKAFSDEGEEGFTATIYDDFVESAYPVLKKMTGSRLEKYMENTYYDIEAIQRVLTANNQFYKGNSYRKTVFYYLSSAPFKSRTLFECIEKKYRGKFEFLELFKQSKGNVHRNIFQYFLFNEFSHQKESIHSRAIPFLQELKKIVSQKKAHDRQTQKTDEGIPTIHSEIQNELNVLLQKYFLRIENHFYNGLIKNYRSTLQRIIREGSELQSVLMDQFGEFLHYQEEDSSTMDLGYNLSKFNQLEWLYRAIQKDTSAIYGIKIRFNESDSIRFHFHHLPYLLFVYDKSMHDKYGSLYSAMIEISNIDHENVNHETELILFLRKLLRNKVRRLDERILETLLLTFVDLLAVNIKNEEMPVGDIEGLLIGLLEKQLHILNHIDMASRKMDNYKSRSKKETPLANEVRYILLHLYRRNVCYDKILEMERFIVGSGTHDPRLYHSLAIGLISRFYYYRKHEPSTIDFVRIIDYLKKAELNYAQLLKRTINKDVQKLIQRNQLGVLNSLCNSYMAMHREHRDINFMEMGRHYLSRLKDCFDEMDLNYDEFPIVNNTEAWLECYESEIFFEANEQLLARKKFSFARKRFEKSLSKPSLMLPHFKDDLSLKIAELESLLNRKNK